MAEAIPAQNPATRKPLTQERLKEVLHYDPETGVFTWRQKMPPRGRVGSEHLIEKRPGCFYRLISINGNKYYAHTLAWLYVHGSMAMEIDHSDGYGANNRITNLRPCSRTQNNANSRMDRRNTSGVKGVSWFAQTGRWQAKVTIHGRQIHLGYFDDLLDAKTIREAAARDLFGEFARSA